MSQENSTRRTAERRCGVRDYHERPGTRLVGLDDGTGARHHVHGAYNRPLKHGSVYGLVLILLISSVLLGLAFSGLESSVSSPTRSLVIHSPIRIDSDADFTSQGWPGDGSASNPYVIEGFEINATGHRNGIFIGNTTLHFRVDTCVVTSASDAGIHLFNVRNGVVTECTSSVNDWYCLVALNCLDTRIDNCTLTEAEYGLMISGCENITVADTQCLRMTSSGIVVTSSVGCLLAGNLCGDNEDEGILVQSSPQMRLVDNYCYGSTYGIRLLQSSHNGTSFGDIATNNMVAGFTVECSDSITIENGTFTGNAAWFGISSGISLLYSNNSRLAGNNCSSSMQGISISRCDNCTIERASCFSNVGYGSMMSYQPGNGIIASMSDDLLVRNCTVSRFGGYGLNLYKCNRVSAEDCIMSNGVMYGGSIKRDSTGVEMFEGGNISLVRCNCSNNDWWGIRVGSPDVLVSKCNVSGNQYDGIRASSTREFKVDNCTAIGNRYDLYVTKSDPGTTIENNTLGLTNLVSSSYVTMKNNSHIGLGLVLSGTAIAWNSHDIDETNTVKGNPIAYLAGESGLTVPPGAGQVILASCSDISVANQFLSDVAIGLQVGYCEDIEVKDCEFARDLTGAYLFETNSGTVSGCLFWTNSECGINLVNCHGNFVWNNSFFGTSVLATTSTTDNYWNITGYGNLWEDWQSPDLNFDGIVDNPRPVPYGTYDYYPLAYSPTTVPELSVTTLALAVTGMLLLVMGLKRGKSRAGRTG